MSQTSKPQFLQGGRTYVIAEAEINHNGKLETALEMIDVAREVGADAIKFQYVIADEIATPDSPYYPLFKKVELSFEAFQQLFAHARRQGIDCFATVPSLGTLDKVLKLDPPILKIGSTNLTNLPLLRAIGATGVPVLLSTGLGTLGEIEQALEALAATPEKVGLFHCTVKYPAPLATLNLRAITTMRAAFPGYQVGFSDHSEGELAAVAAITLGASILEKHFTLDRTQEGPDHGFSTDPAQFRQLMQAVRGIEQALGDGVKRAVPEEAGAIRGARRYLVAGQAIRAGEVLSPDKLQLRRIDASKQGMEPAMLERLDGWRAPRDYQPGQALLWEDFRQPGGTA